MYNYKHFLIAGTSILYYLIFVRFIEIVREISQFLMVKFEQKEIILIGLSLIFIASTLFALHISKIIMRRLNSKIIILILVLTFIFPLIQFVIPFIFEQVEPTSVDKIDYLEFYGYTQAISSASTYLFIFGLFLIGYKTKINHTSNV